MKKIVIITSGLLGTKSVLARIRSTEVFSAVLQEYDVDICNISI